MYRVAGRLQRLVIRLRRTAALFSFYLRSGLKLAQDLFCKELRLLPSCKVAALVEVVVVDEFGIRRSAQLRGAGYSSSAKTLTAIGMETPFALKYKVVQK